MFFDILIFLANLFLMRLLTRLFMDLFRQAAAENKLARFTLGLYCLGMLILPAIGATLKRWRFHQRLNWKSIEAQKSALSGCLFNPIFYFCLNLTIVSVVVAIIAENIGENSQNGISGFVFLPLLFTGVGLTILQTYLIYRYFSPPKKPPALKFLLTPPKAKLSETYAFC